MKVINYIYLVFIIFLTFVYSSYSQFTITYSYKPVLGDTIELKDVDTTGITAGQGGANQVWDYSNIQVQPGIFYERFVQPSSTPYYSQFPNSNAATINSDSPTIYHYYQTTGTDWLLNGFAYTGFIKTYSEPLCRMHFPLSYGEQFSSSFRGVGYSGNAIYYYSGSRNFSGDGYGTLILPSGTYYNTLRIKILYENFDTIKVNGVVVQTDHMYITEHAWYVEGYKFPFFIIDEITSNQISYLKSIFLGSRIPVVGIRKVSEKVPDKFVLHQNYPNPFNPSTKIRFSVPIIPLNPPSKGERGMIVRLVIYDILGRETAVLVNAKLLPGTYEVTFDVGSRNGRCPASGVCFYRLEAGNYVQTKKMILLK